MKKNTRRNPEDMPKLGQVVTVAETNKTHYGRCGIVVDDKRHTNSSTRPYEVKFNDGNIIKFRPCDVWVTE